MYFLFINFLLQSKFSVVVVIVPHFTFIGNLAPLHVTHHSHYKSRYFCLLQYVTPDICSLPSLAVHKTNAIFDWITNPIFDNHPIRLFNITSDQTIIFLTWITLHFSSQFFFFLFANIHIFLHRLWLYERFCNIDRICTSFF